MQKEELLHLHMLMVHIKKFYETTTGESIDTSRYVGLEVSPVHIHKNKKSHKEALLILGEEIVGSMRDQKRPVFDLTADPVIEPVAVEH
ncbi:MAG TPA: hypothetical protein HA263_08970 [Methanoregulaceae archaeon]|nr:hypothetical protein [Methanoregulaceae archaeon]